MTPKITGTLVMDPQSLEEGERKNLTERLYGVHRQIFDGVGEDRFYSRVVCPPAQRTRILVALDGSAWVGYHAVHGYRRAVGGRGHTVFRSEIGLLRPYRGQGLVLQAFAFYEFLRFKLRHPWEQTCFLDTAVHPASYRHGVRGLPGFTPHFRRAPRGKTLAWMNALAESFHLERVNPADPLVVKVGWITREEATDRAFWQGHPDPAVRFFLARNPGYAQGDGLLVWAPITLPRLALVLGRGVFRYILPWRRPD
ncbi:MAG: hypothetical protein OEV94_01220 [Deltaproteobacteria bacterium]|nr:hypothetical protein [Deltaproteobacteria bacterium]